MRKKDEACLLCGTNPCTCSQSSMLAKVPASQKKKLGKSSNRFSSVTVPTNTSTFQSSPETGAGSKPPFSLATTSSTPQTRFQDSASETQPKSEDELEFEAALRNLESVLDVSVKNRYASVFRPVVPTKLQRLIKEWRERNGLA